MPKVRLIKRSEQAYFVCRWTDDLTGKLRSRSTKTSHRRDAERFAARLESELEAGGGENLRSTFRDTAGMKTPPLFGRAIDAIDATVVPVVELDGGSGIRAKVAFTVDSGVYRNVRWSVARAVDDSTVDFLEGD